MRQFEHDPYEMLTRCIEHDAPIVVLDVGANRGDTVVRTKQEYPNAIVHAFEPVGDVFEELRAATRGLSDVHLHRVAVGEKPGEVELHVTKNRWCSSVLQPGERGKAYYGDWYNVERTERVPMVSLDSWAEAHHVRRVDIIKIDVQGLELSVLRGARRLLSQGGVKAVLCEAQLVQEYEGSSTFSEIDLDLRSHGFLVHQIHEVVVKGPEQQSSYLDATWMHKDVLERLRKHLKPVQSRHCAAMLKAVAQCVAQGRTRIALYGAGHHTAKIMPALEKVRSEGRCEVCCVLDDAPAKRGSSVAGLPVEPSSAAQLRGVQAVILNTDTHEKALWQASEPMRRAGMLVVPLYQQFSV